MNTKYNLKIYRKRETPKSISEKNNRLINKTT